MRTIPAMRTLRLALSAALLATLPAAGRAAAYGDLAARANHLENLGTFLERYVGACNDPLTRVDCEANVKAQRRTLDGALYAASLAEGTLDIVKVERRGDRLRFVVTPFIDGGGLALTHGAPRQQDAAGHPVIGLLVLEGQLPAGMDELSLDSALRTGRLAMEVLFEPEGTWKLKKKGEAGFYEGVRARFVGIRLVETRSGQELASRVFANGAS